MPEPLGEDREHLRRRVLKALRIYFAQRRWPRLAMSGIMLATGATGFLASFLMLKAGLDELWARYAIATLLAWLAFLAMLRVWAEIERRYFHAGEEIEELLNGEDPAGVCTRLEQLDWSVLDLLDIPADFDVDGEGCLAAVLLTFLFAVAAVALWAVLSLVIAAPILIAEVFLDAVLVTALYRRVRRLDARWWLAGAVRQTAGPVIATTVALMVAGFLIQTFAPGAKSIGDVWRNEPATER